MASDRGVPTLADKVFKGVMAPGAIMFTLGAGYFILPEMGYQFVVLRHMGPAIPRILLVLGIAANVGSVLFLSGVAIKRSREATKAEHQLRSARSKKCPACGDPYDPVDYDDHSSRWLCSKCNTDLPRG